MRLTLVVFLCMLNTGCALFRADRDEPVEPPKAPKPKVEEVLKPSDVLKPKSLEIASPVSDQFALRFMYFNAGVNTTLQVDPQQGIPGTRLSAEKDLQLDDRIDQVRMEVDLRLKKYHHLHLDFFKLSRFHEARLQRDIVFGDFVFPETTPFRANLDWRVFTLTHSYSFIHWDRWEMGAGLGAHFIQAQAEGGQPGTLNREKTSKFAIFPTLGVNTAFRISKRWSVTARGQYFHASADDFEGSMSDYHADLQYRWRKNFAVGLGFTKLSSHLKSNDVDEPILFDLDTTGPELFFRASF